MKLFIVIILVVVAAFGLQQYAVPAWQHIQAANKELDAIDGIEREAKDIVAKRNEVLERYKSIDQSQLARLDHLLPKSLIPEDLYVFLERTTRDIGMTFGGATISEGASAATGRRTINFDLKVSGSYRAFRSLLDALENNTRLMDISTINITQNERGEVNIVLNGRMYYGE